MSNPLKAIAEKLQFGHGSKAVETPIGAVVIRRHNKALQFGHGSKAVETPSSN